MLCLPLLFGVLARNHDAVIGMAGAVYFFGVLGFVGNSTKALRGRGTKVMEMTIPVSNAERMTFMLFNLMVAFPLVAIVSFVVAITLGVPFYFVDISLVARISEIMSSFYLEWTIYVLIQLIASACLLINLLARRNLFIAYVGAFVGVMIFFGVLGNIGYEISLHYDLSFLNEIAIEIDEDKFRMWSIAIYCSLPVVFYALSFWALCKRQIKW